MMWTTAITAAFIGLVSAPGFADEWRPDLIAKYESDGGQNVPNYLFNGVRGTRSAGGVCQMLTRTWLSVAPTIDIDIEKFPVAGAASEFDQWRACWKLWTMRGYEPWTCCNAKLKQALANRGVETAPVRKVPSVAQAKEKQPGLSDKVAIFSARLAANSDVFHR